MRKMKILVEDKSITDYDSENILAQREIYDLHRRSHFVLFAMPQILCKLFHLRSWQFSWQLNENTNKSLAGRYRPLVLGMV